MRLSEVESVSVSESPHSNSPRSSRANFFFTPLFTPLLTPSTSVANESDECLIENYAEPDISPDSPSSDEYESRQLPTAMYEFANTKNPSYQNPTSTIDAESSGKQQTYMYSSVEGYPPVTSPSQLTPPSNSYSDKVLSPTLSPGSPPAVPDYSHLQRQRQRHAIAPSTRSTNLGMPLSLTLTPGYPPAASDDPHLQRQRQRHAIAPSTRSTGMSLSPILTPVSPPAVSRLQRQKQRQLIALSTTSTGMSLSPTLTPGYPPAASDDPHLQRQTHAIAPSTRSPAGSISRMSFSPTLTPDSLPTDPRVQSERQRYATRLSSTAGCISGVSLSPTSCSPPAAPEDKQRQRQRQGFREGLPSSTRN